MITGEIDDVWSGHERELLSIEETDKDGRLPSGDTVRVHLDHDGSLVRESLRTVPDTKPLVINKSFCTMKKTPILETDHLVFLIQTSAAVQVRVIQNVCC